MDFRCLGATWVTILACVTARALAAPSPRAVSNIDFDWCFVQGEQRGAENSGFDDSTWRKLDLPHDFSAEADYRQDAPGGGTNAYKGGGIGWYRRVIEVPAEWIGKRVEVQIDAASRNSEVWINGQHLGLRPYGFMSFSYDLTPHLHEGKNVLAVKVDTTKQPGARWYMGSGIYAHVNLVISDKLHVPQWGTFVTTSNVSRDSATVEINTEVTNDTTEARDVKVASEIIDDGEASVATLASTATVDAGKTSTIKHTIVVPRPKLWSPESPDLYRLITRIYRGGSLVDQYQTSFGIRSMRWDANSGFWLNDRNVKLKGMGIYWDGGGLGYAVPDQVMEWRLKLLKKMGCNAVRANMNPLPPKFYDMCDRLGLLVMDGIFDGWRKKAAHDYGAEAFAEWWKRDLTDWIRRDRNHPGIVMWSIGNETGNTDTLGMTKIIHELDPTRVTTGGQVLYGVDVAGFNGPGEEPGVLEKFHKENPHTPIVLTEETHGYQTRGFYRTVTWWRDTNPQKRVPFPPYSTEEVFKYGGDPQYCSSYDNATVRMTNRQCWKRTRDTPWISGQFRWTSFDYMGEAAWGSRHWPARYWHPGIIDSAGFPKDIYYFYQSQWCEEPMVHLLPHWTHPLVTKGTRIPVVAYSNCDQVELFLSTASLGKQKPRELLDFVWQVPYDPGELKAVGYRDGKQVATAISRTAGPATKLMLEADHDRMKSDRRDVTMVAVSIVDEQGELVPDANNRVDFKLLGPARTLGYENGNPTDVSSNHVDHRDAFAGLLRGYYQSTGDDGPVELVAAAALGRTPFQQSTRITLALARIALRGELSRAGFVMRYTTDGSKPTAASTLYQSPFEIDHPAAVRMLVLRDGQPFLNSEAKFEQGLPPTFDDPRYESSTTRSTTFPSGPHDSEMAGVWTAGKRRLHFREDGVVLRVEKDGERAVGNWWYDFPDDVFENSSETGGGAMQWLSSDETSTLKLEDVKARSMTLETGARRTRFEKAQSK